MAKKNSDKILTYLIIILSIAGVVYFGLSAIRSDNKRVQNNPFEYDIEEYEKSGTDLLSYEEIATIPLQLDQPHALAVDENDRIYVTTGSNLVVYDAAGNQIAEGSANSAISALDVDANGHVYLALNETVEVLDSSLTRAALWPSLGERAVLTSIAVDESNVYLADAGQRIIWRFDKTGLLLNRIGERDDTRDIPGFVIPSPYFDVAVDSDGYLWAVNTGRHQFENYMPDGSLRGSWSKSSMSVDGFSGCCNPVHIALLTDGSFVTSEKGILRIKIHNPVGELSDVVALPDQFSSDTEAVEVAVNSREQILLLDPQRKQIRIFQKKDITS